MSRAGSKPISLEARMGEAIAAIGLLPPAVRGAMRVKVYDILSHHRQSVLSRVGRNWPGGREAQKMVASRSFRYTRFNENGIAGIDGQAFIGAVKGETFGDEAFEQWEQGASIDASGPMAIPMGKGATTRGKATKAFEKRLGDAKFNITPRGLLVRQVGGEKARSEIHGVLTSRRRQRPILGWHERWRDVVSRDLPKLERAIDAAVNATDKQSVELRARREVLADAVRRQTYRGYLEAHPKKFRDAQRVADRAAAEATRTNVVRGRR